MAYVDLAYVSLIAPIRPEVISAYETENPGTFVAIAEAVSRMFDARLTKRYATPFKDPVPEAIRFHVAMVVAYQLWLKVGYDPGSSQDEGIKEARDNALEWLKEAADSVAGTVELPVREEPIVGDRSAISRSGPKSYTEVTAYDWVRRQGERRRTMR